MSFSLLSLLVPPSSLLRHSLILSLSYNFSSHPSLFTHLSICQFLVLLLSLLLQSSFLILIFLSCPWSFFVHFLLLSLFFIHPSLTAFPIHTSRIGMHPLSINRFMTICPPLPSTLPSLGYSNLHYFLHSIPFCFHRHCNLNPSISHLRHSAFPPHLPPHHNLTLLPHPINSFCTRSLFIPNVTVTSVHPSTISINLLFLLIIFPITTTSTCPPHQLSGL